MDSMSRHGDPKSKPIPYPQRTYILRPLGPKTLLYKALGYFDAKGMLLDAKPAMLPDLTYHDQPQHNTLAKAGSKDTKGSDSVDTVLCTTTLISRYLYFFRGYGSGLRVEGSRPWT